MGSGIPDCSDHRSDIRIFRDSCGGGWNRQNPIRDLHHPVPYFTRRWVDAANVDLSAATLVHSDDRGTRSLCLLLSWVAPQNSKG
jgi:hypothetical protein